MGPLPPIERRKEPRQSAHPKGTDRDRCQLHCPPGQNLTTVASFLFLHLCGKGHLGYSFSEHVSGYEEGLGSR